MIMVNLTDIPVADHCVQDGERVAGHACGDRQSAGHDEGGLAGSGGVAGVGEPAEVDLVAMFEGVPPGEQRPVRARCDSLEGEALVLGEVEQPFRGSQLGPSATVVIPGSPGPGVAGC